MPKKDIYLPVAAEPAKTSAAISHEASSPAAEPAWLRPMVEAILGETTAKAPPPTPFTDFAGLVRHLPMYGERTLRQLVKDRIIPAVRPPWLAQTRIPYSFGPKQSAPLPGRRH